MPGIIHRLTARARITWTAVTDPQGVVRLNCIRAGEEYAARWSTPLPAAPPAPIEPNPLETFFDARREGPGIWKWRHYFEVYHRHLAKFRGRAPVVLEIGIYSGGSLDLWRDYFGESARLYGCDIEPACKCYERPGVSVVIGDQGDREFWRRSFASGAIPAPDIIIDDGSHQQDHQRITMEELLPALSPGGVYICEDVHRRGSHFAAFAHGLGDSLNAMEGRAELSDDAGWQGVLPTTAFQSAVHSIHLYPFMVVVEKQSVPRTGFVSAKHGTEWQPFLS